MPESTRHGAHGNEALAAAAPMKSFAWTFLLLCALLYGLCAILPDSFFEPVNRYTAAMTAFILTQIGSQPQLNGVIISMDGFSAKIITECSAVMVLILFCAFVLAYPTVLRDKSVGLAFGVPLLIGANLIRLVMVCLTGSHFPDLFEVAHIYLGQMIMIVLVFAACLFWLRSFAKTAGDIAPLAFVGRFLAISAIPFAIWIYLHRGYVLMDAWIVEGLFKLSGYDLHLSPNMETIYPNTFNLIAFTGLILASSKIDRRRRIRSLGVGLGILAAVHVVLRILQVLVATSGEPAAVKLLAGLILLNTYLLPFVLWLILVRRDVFNIPQIPVCPYCGARKIGLEQHIRAKHKGEHLPRANRQTPVALQVLPVAAGCLLLFNAATLFADYKDDVGYTQLDSELDAATPDGSGVAVAHVEAKNTDENWMPDTSNSQFTGKSIVDKTGGATGTSGHATGVGQKFYGNTSSMAPGATDIDAYEVNDWLQLGFLGVGYTYNGKPFQPVYDRSTSPWNPASPARVANHSWVGSWSGYEDDILRRLDFVIDSDDYIQITAVGSTTQPLLGDSFNSITVGCTDGSHPMGTSGIDDIYVSGRSCPLVVAPFSTRSAAVPAVASAAALLVATGRNPNLSTDPAAVSTANRNGDEIFNGERSETVKAALLAGARRVTYNTSATEQITDYTQDSANGLDRRFGAGQLDIYNSYHIIAAGEQNSAEDQPAGGGAINCFGFDVDPSFGGGTGSNNTGSYSFVPNADQRRLYASLVWNLRVDGGTAQDYDDTAVLYDLNLALYDVTVEGYPRLVAESASTLDNTENLWAALVPARSYRMEIKAASGQDPFEWDYTLAWRMETPPDTDSDGIPDDWELQNGLDHTRSSDGNLDNDGDQATNLVEFATGTDPANGDTDGDGQADGVELAHGSDPLNPNETAVIQSVPAIRPMAVGLAALVIGFGPCCRKSMVTRASHVTIGKTTSPNPRT
jgi:exosortase H (IPTLxxWG-CTERM-specific)